MSARGLKETHESWGRTTRKRCFAPPKAHDRAWLKKKSRLFRFTVLFGLELIRAAARDSDLEVIKS